MLWDNSGSGAVVAQLAVCYGQKKVPYILYGVQAAWCCLLRPGKSRTVGRRQQALVGGSGIAVGRAFAGFARGKGQCQ